ncbi:MAG: type II toxin-antitoxin system VapC family toxin [Acidobacteria bacterium]|jgi:predicted nucleic acid-binding protein|nr:type II toxin-antitoxin system VapC family toxin [Acidobacteriota bacterium]MBA4122944.1 type II toxin-antitoxin system VapC family toxin [Acidobacteriota bacterium]MBA4182832.1 type II toxin-antitoxin system VapC family toxin [Acidobacteriota bacterium]
MAAYYFDSSATVKRFAKEKGTNFVLDLMRPSAKNLIYAARITEVEVCAALSRRRKGKTLTADYATKAIARWQRVFDRNIFQVKLTDAIFREAVRLADIHALRGYDSVQLACALLTNQDRLSRNLPALVFVSADDELNKVAQAESLTIENPNNY